MKKFILFLLLLMPVYTNAQIVGGEYQCVTAGSNVKFWPYTFDEKTFLVMEFTNHNNCFLPGCPVVKSINTLPVVYKRSKWAGKKY